MRDISFELHPNQDGTWDVVIHDPNVDAKKNNELQNTDLDNAFAFILATVGNSAVRTAALPCPNPECKEADAARYGESRCSAARSGDQRDLVAGVQPDLRTSFDAWCDEVDKIGRSAPYELPFDCTKESGREYWRQYYESGETPESAMAEDASHCDG